MKKVLAGLAMVSMIAAVAMPYVSGLIMERVVRQAQQDVNAMYAETGNDIQLEIEAYDRGFSSTDIEWKIRLGSLKAVLGVDEIIFTERARHGYLGVASTTSLEKNSWYTKFVSEHLAGKEPFTIDTEYSLLGDIDSIVKIIAMRVPVEDEILEIKPGELLLHSENGISKLGIKGTWEGMAVGSKLAMEGFSFFGDLEKVSSYIWAGNFDFAVQSISAAGADDDFAVSNLRTGSDIDYSRKENRLSIRVAYGFDKMFAGGNNIEDGRFAVAFNDIDAAGYEEFMKVYTTTVQQVLGDLSDSADNPEAAAARVEEQMAGQGLQFMAAYEQLLKKDLQIDITEISARLPEGKVQGSMMLRLNKDMTLARLMPLMGQPALALDVFSFTSAVRFPMALASDDARLTSPVMPGMQTGIFVKEGDYYVHKAETRDGRLFLNNREVQL